MTYKKIGFKDRIVERPMTYNIITNEDGTITLEPVTGEVYEKGTDMNANNMDHIEEGIVELNSKIENLESKVYVKGNYAVLEGTIITPDANDQNVVGNIRFNYPSGFNKNNCIIISLMAGRISSDYGNNLAYATTINKDRTASHALGNGDLICVLSDDEIRVDIAKLATNLSSYQSNIKVALLKYKD